MKDQHGQAMVLAAFALIALIAITGLAIDGGRLYQARRQSQNAADAAALAGTRIIANQRCNPGTDLDTQVRAEIVDYARQNSVVHDGINGQIWAWYVNLDSTRLQVVGTGSVPNGTTGVEVSTMITESTSFMRILGQNAMAAAGRGTAMFGPLQAGGGFLPMAFPAQRVDEILASGTTEFTIFDADGGICDRAGVNCPSNPPEQSQRGWLNFAYIYNHDYNHAVYHTGPDYGNWSEYPLDRVRESNFSNANLQEWAEHGSPYPLFAGTRGAPPYNLDGDFIAGSPGVRNVTSSIICDTYQSETVYIPVFDYIYKRAEMQSSFPGDEEPPNPRQFPGGQTHYYHIVGFLAARLDYCEGGGANRKINGTFQYATIGQGQIEPGDGIQSGSGAHCDPRLTAVVLWE